MIVLDTDVISEIIKGPRADPRVMAWLRTIEEQPVTTVINRAELLAGVAMLPSGRRRDTLTGAVEAALADLAICLPFSGDSAPAYAAIVASRTRAGQPIAAMDALAASIAMVNRAGVATRDVAGFDGLGLRVIDPWSVPLVE